MNCIGFPDKPCTRQRFRLLFKHLLLAIFVIFAQSGLGTALALEPVVKSDVKANEPELQEAPDFIDPTPTSSSSSSSSSSSPFSLDDAAASAKGASPGEHYNPTDLAFVSRYLKSTDYIPVSEIKPGMEGYGLTVFQGTKIEKFNVKVIGIIRKALNGRDAILIRLSGEKLGKNNVVRGMSGSPIYLNGRLCGALSYGFDFSKEPIVGVTPVVDMLDSLTFHDEERSRHGRNKVSLLKRLPYIEAPAASLMIPNTVPVAGGTLRMTPLLAPVSLSGYSPRAQEFLKDKFADVGLGISSGATGALDPGLIPKMSGQAHTSRGDGEEDYPSGSQSKVAPGASVAVMLSTGAFASAATGTATASFGNKVVAFGHAFMEGGSVSLPLATAYILEILPSLSVSFKLSSPIQIIGSIFADRPWSVGAEVGRFASMVPVNITVTDEGRGVTKVFHCKVVNHPQLTPDLVTASVMSSLDSTFQSQTPYVVKVESAIDVKDHGVIKRTDRFPVNFSAHASTADALSRMRFGGDPVSGYLGGIVDRLISNDFERAHVNSVTVNATVEDGRKVTKIDRISLDKSVVAPGEEVKLNCLMKPYNAAPYNKQVTFHIPRDVPDGDLALAACGGDELDTVRKRMGLSEPVPESLYQIIEKVEHKGRGDSLCAILALPQQSLILDGQLLKSPPAQWTKLFFTDRSTKTPSLVRSDESFNQVCDTIIDGSHIIAVTVRRTDKVMSKAAPFAVSASGSHSTDSLHITEQARKALDSGHKTDSTATPAAATAASAAAATPAADSAPKVPPMWSVASAFPHMRGIQLWRQDGEENFRGAKLDGIEVDSWGRLTPGFHELAKIYPDMAEDQRIWAGTYLKEYFYYALGNKICRWDGSAAAAPQVVASTSGLLIPCLAADNAHSILYYAAAPGDAVMALNVASGQSKILTKINQGTITSLAVADSGTVYIGTAGTGKLYQVRPGASTAELVFDSGQAHISALWYCRRENRLYVGTAEKGCVYSVACGPAVDSARAGQVSTNVKAEFESGEHIVTGIAKDIAGNLYVATAGSGKLLRVESNGEAEPIALSDAFYSLYYDNKDDHIYAGDGEGDVTRVEIEPLNDQVHFLPVCHTEQEAVLALASDGQGRLFCGTANVAQLRSFEIAPSAEPSMQSLVHDAQRKAEWSRIRLADLYNADKISFDRFVKVETRGGETSQPDLSWSPWTVAEPDSDGFVVKTPPSRFLQYKLTWKIASADKDAMKKRDLLISRVDVTYLPNNFAPTFTSVSVKAGDSLSGKVPVTATGADPDCDNLLLNVALSADGGKTWKNVASDVRSRPSEKEREKEKSRERDKDKIKTRVKETEKGNGKGSVTETDTTDKSHTETVGKKSDRIEDKSENKSGEKSRGKSGAKSADKNDDKSGDILKDKSKDKTVQQSQDASRVKLQDAFVVPNKDNNEDDAAGKKSGDNKSDKDDNVDKGKEKEKNVTKGKTRDEASDSSKGGENYNLSEKITYTLDSKKEKDGQYILRLILSDAPSNAVGQESATVFRAVTIDNSEPEFDSVVVKKSGPGRASLRVVAHDSVSDVSDCLYKIDDGEGFALSPAGTPLSDATHAVFVGDDIQYDDQAKKLVVQIFDRAGNSAKKTVNLP